MRNFTRRLYAAFTSRDPIHAEAVEMQTALGLLSDRYLEIADKASSEAARARAVQIRQAGNDIRHTLIHGRIPSYLMTDTEPEQHGAPEEAGR